MGTIYTCHNAQNLDIFGLNSDNDIIYLLKAFGGKINGMDVSSRGWLLCDCDTL